MPDRAGTILQLIAMNRAEQSYKFTGQVRGYVRVSTEDQTVEQQKVFLLRNLPAGVQPEDVVWYEDEGYSAFKTPMDKRPAGHMPRPILNRRSYSGVETRPNVPIAVGHVANGTTT